MSATEQKLKAREAALANLDKQFGKGTAMLYGAMEPLEIEVIPTGSLALDDALGVGGYPRGRIVEIFGPEASGKTTLTLHAMAEAQKAGGLVAFVDAEHALDVNYARNLGVDMDNVVLSQPDYGEQALEIVEQLISSNAFDLVVVDSVAALVPKAEIDGEMGDSHVGLQARLMSQALRKLTSVVHRSKTTLIFINQIRMKIGIRFGSPETTTGGNGLPFYATQRIDIRRIGNIKKGDEVIGGRTRVKVKKNKVAVPFKECEFDIIYGKGVNKAGEILDAAVALALVEKSGAWYTVSGDRFQGRDAAVQGLLDNPELMATMEKQVRGQYGVKS